MKSFRAALAVLLVALAAFFAGSGFARLRGIGGHPAEVPAAGETPETASPEETGAALAAAVKDRDLLRERLQGAPAPEGAFEEAADSLIADLIRKKNGNALLAMVWRLGTRGPSAYAKIVEILSALHGDPRGFGLDYNATDKAFLGPLVPFMTWALRNPGSTPEWIRDRAILELVRMPECGPVELLLEVLHDPASSDTHYMAAICLDVCLPPERLPEIQALAEAADDRKQKQGLLETIFEVGREDGRPLLEKLAQHKDPEIADEARVLLVKMNPPATGFLVRDLDEDSTAWAGGLRRGDIFIRVGDDQPPTQSAIFALGDLEEGQVARARVNRGGVEIDLEWHVGGYCPIYGDAVEKPE